MKCQFCKMKQHYPEVGYHPICVIKYISWLVCYLIRGLEEGKQTIDCACYLLESFATSSQGIVTDSAPFYWTLYWIHSITTFIHLTYNRAFQWPPIGGSSSRVASNWVLWASWILTRSICGGVRQSCTDSWSDHLPHDMLYSIKTISALCFT
jgi:hypothetical protein